MLARFQAPKQASSSRDCRRLPAGPVPRSALGPDEFLTQLKSKNRAAIDEWQTESLLKPMRRGNVELYAPGLSPEEAALTGVKVIESMDRAVSESVERSTEPRVAVIPEGPYVVPFVEPTTN